MGNDFTEEDDDNLAIYLSFNSTGKEERLGDNLYQKLVLNVRIFSAHCGWC